MLLGGDSDHEGWNINDLLSNGDVSLSDKDSGVMDAGSELSLGDKGLESSFHELVNGKTENVIELSLVLLQQTELDNSSNESVTLEDSLGIVLQEGHELSGSLSKLGEGELNSPHFSLVLKSVGTDDLELIDESILIEGLSWGLGSFLVVCVFLWHVEDIYLCYSGKVQNNNKNKIRDAIIYTQVAR